MKVEKLFGNRSSFALKELLLWMGDNKVQSGSSGADSRSAGYKGLGIPSDNGKWCKGRARTPGSLAADKP